MSPRILQHFASLEDPRIDRNKLRNRLPPLPARILAFRGLCDKIRLMCKDMP
jgi:hypothetical protein